MNRMSWMLVALAVAGCSGAPRRPDDSRAQGGGTITAPPDRPSERPTTPAQQQERQKKLIEATDATRAAARALEGASDAERTQKLTDYLAALDAAPAQAIAQL